MRWSEKGKQEIEVDWKDMESHYCSFLPSKEPAEETVSVAAANSYLLHEVLEETGRLPL